ncbi:MAG: ParB/RepB/Spo0J family partition protein [Pseudonocardia sp.]
MAMGWVSDPVVGQAQSMAGPVCPRPVRESGAVGLVAPGRIRVHHRNIRRSLGDLSGLVESVRRDGVLVPLMAHRRYRRGGAGGVELELLHGHRRLAAAELAGLSRVPVVVVPYHDVDEALVVMLAENTRREELTGLDRAHAVRALIEEFGFTPTGLAARLGISIAELRRWARPPGGSAGSRRRSPHPSIRPTAVHELLGRWETGELDAEGMAAQLRGLLGGWVPRVVEPSPPAAPAEVVGLFEGAA